MQTNTEYQTNPAGEPTPAPSPASPPPGNRPYAGYYPDSRSKSPLVAAFLSLMPGLGQVYVGYYQQGFIHIAVVGTLISLLASNAVTGLVPLLGMFLVFFWLYNIVDAGRRAAYFNQALAGLEPGELPKSVGFPGAESSLVVGAILIIVGGIALSHTLLGYPLDWLEDWWPVALVLVGGYLIYKALTEKKTLS